MKSKKMLSHLIKVLSKFGKIVRLFSPSRTFSIMNRMQWHMHKLNIIIISSIIKKKNKKLLKKSKVQRSVYIKRPFDHRVAYPNLIKITLS